jgi:hypothetical protein
MNAIISPCGLYRYRLDRIVLDALTLLMPTEVQPHLVFAYFGVNPSKADATTEDQTTHKWRGFTRINNGRAYIAGNPFAFRATDVDELARAEDPVGPDNASHLDAIIAEAHVLVPCWGSRNKLPKVLHHHLDALAARLMASGKPVRVFGTTKSGDPQHPLMLGYDTPLVAWGGFA